MPPRSCRVLHTHTHTHSVTQCPSYRVTSRCRGDNDLLFSPFGPSLRRQSRSSGPIRVAPTWRWNESPFKWRPCAWRKTKWVSAAGRRKNWSCPRWMRRWAFCRRSNEPDGEGGRGVNGSLTAKITDDFDGTDDEKEDSKRETIGEKS